MLPTRDYQLIEATVSICPLCLERVSAKIVNKEGEAWLLKSCPTHGRQEEILEEDAEYFINRTAYDKPGTITKTQTETKKGCPFDCGLCPEHEQHTCIGLIEITNACGLKCPTCYAEAGTGYFLDLKTIGKMMDFYMDSEYGEAEILQISGGEPTLHPQILDILSLAHKKKFKCLMLNTNGIRIAEDEAFAKALAEFTGGFEVYLQFDGFKKKTAQHLRGKADLMDIKRRAIAHLQKYRVPMTLVATIQRGINDQEIGEIVRFALEEKYIRGINFQPVAFFGRMPKMSTKGRITLTGILRELAQQTDFLTAPDFTPLPCDPDRVAITYLHRKNGEWRSLGREIDLKKSLPEIGNTFAFHMEDFKKKRTGILNCCGGDSSCCGNFTNEIRSLVGPSVWLKSKTGQRDYINESFFRISIKSFIDVYNFDLRSVQKDCVHIITPDLKKIPFSTFNMFYRQQYAAA